MKKNFLRGRLSSVRSYLAKLAIEKIFLVLFLAFGLVFVAIIPPGWNTDEPDHTYRIYQLSVGNLFSEEVTSPLGNRAFGGQVPSGLVNLYKDAGVRDAGASAVDATQKARDLYKQNPEMAKYTYDGTLSEINFSGAALYSPVTYAIYIPVYLAGKLFSLSFLSTLIIARIIGLIITGLAFYFAIKHIKVGKWAILVIGLLPTTVIQAASVGADAPLIATSVLFVMYAVNRIFQKDPVTNKQFAVLALLGALLTFMKLAYAPFVLLILAMPFIKKSFNKKSIIAALIAVCIALVPSIIWTMSVSYIDTNSNLQADFSLQKEFILTDPYSYLKTIYYTFFTPERAPLEGMFGTAIWGSVTLPAIFTYLAVAIAVLSISVRDKREQAIEKVGIFFNRAWRISLLLVSAMTVVLIATVLYIYSSTLYQSTIIGLQSRYFVPLLPLILIAAYGNFYKKQNFIKFIILFVITVILIGMVLIVYHRLYQTLPLLLR